MALAMRRLLTTLFWAQKQQQQSVSSSSRVEEQEEEEGLLEDLSGGSNCFWTLSNVVQLLCCSLLVHMCTLYFSIPVVYLYAMLVCTAWHSRQAALFLESGWGEIRLFVFRQVRSWSTVKIMSQIQLRSHFVIYFRIQIFSIANVSNRRNTAILPKSTNKSATIFSKNFWLPKSFLCNNFLRNQIFWEQIFIKLLDHVPRLGCICLKKWSENELI